MSLTILDRAVLGLVSRSRSPEVAVIGLRNIESRMPAGRAGLDKAQALLNRQDWPSRYLAAKCLGRYFEVKPDLVMALLGDLASDSNRLVREGSAIGMGEAALAGGQEALGRLISMASAAGPAQRRAIAYSTVWIVKQNPDASVDQIAALLEAVLASAGELDTRQIGKDVIGKGIAVERPELAARLVETWAACGDPRLRHEAERALTECLRERLPARVTAVEALLMGASLREGVGRTLQTGKLEFTDTSEVGVPEAMVDQVIGQDGAVELVRIAAQQKRFVLLVGEPGTGKSMLASAMSQMLAAENLKDVLIYPNRESRVTPLVVEVAAGKGAKVVEVARRRQKTAESSIGFVFWAGIAASAVISLYFALTMDNYLLLAVGGAAALLLLLLRRLFRSTAAIPIPKLLVNNDGRTAAPFIDATGFHEGALLGDVRHDPFQSGGYETPPHQLVEAGAIHQAAGGVLFIDEVSTLGVESQQSLLTAIQEKRFPITGRSPGSSGTMVRTGPVGCDFVLVVAGNMQDIEKMHPALRSRIRGAGYEIYLNASMDDEPANRVKLAQFVAQEVRKDGKIPHFDQDAVNAVIEQCRMRAGVPGKLSLRLRELGGLVRAAGDLAHVEAARLVEARHLAAAVPNARSLEEQIAARDGGSAPAKLRHA